MSTLTQDLDAMPPVPLPRPSPPRISLDMGPLRFVAAFAPDAQPLLRARALSGYVVQRTNGAAQHAVVTRAVATLRGALSTEARASDPDDAELTETDALMVCGVVGAGLARETQAAVGAYLADEVRGAFTAAREALAREWAAVAKTLPRQVLLPLAPLAAFDVPPPPPGLTPRQLAEREKIVKALEATRWNRGKTAEAIGMPRRTLYRRFKDYGIPVRGDDEGSEDAPQADAPAPPLPTLPARSSKPAPAKAPTPKPAAAAPPKGKAKAKR